MCDLHILRSAASSLSCYSLELAASDDGHQAIIINPSSVSVI
jgi:hypothetical protein